ncbi:MAG: ABC transporter permease [Bacteroidetes bacterium]|jgi:lipoprotein-releasing system permease protein|nr:ABC transporter permease [Bacteroidota bacterium]
MTHRVFRRKPQFPIARFIAWRHLMSGHNRRFISFITVIATIGIMLGVASLIITLSILDGFERTIKENVVSFTAHMQLFAFQNQVLPEYEATRRAVMERNPEVVEMAPYLSREGMIRSKTDIDGVVIKGVDPQNDISAAKRRLVEGIYDLEEPERGLQKVILGRRLADKLEAVVGGRVVVYALGGPALSLAQARVMQLEVAAIYETGMADYDGSVVYVNLTTAQRLFQVGRMVSGFDILVSDQGALEGLARRIPEQLGYPYYARTMYQMYRNLFTWIDLQQKPIPIILGLIIIVATVNIIGTVLMMVMEKAREIGALRTLGMKKAALLRIFLTQALLIGAIGTLAGNVLAFVVCWLELKYRFFALPSGIYFMTHVPIELSVLNFLVVSILAVAMTLLAAYLPARFASKLDPVALIRFR